MLEKKDLTVDELFAVENIRTDIKQNGEKMVNYLKTHQEFMKRMLTLSLNTSAEDIEKENLKEIVFGAT